MEYHRFKNILTGKEFQGYYINAVTIVDKETGMVISNNAIKKLKPKIESIEEINKAELLNDDELINAYGKAYHALNTGEFKMIKITWLNQLKNEIITRMGEAI